MMEGKAFGTCFQDSLLSRNRPDLLASNQTAVSCAFSGHSPDHDNHAKQTEMIISPVGSFIFKYILSQLK